MIKQNEVIKNSKVRELNIAADVLSAAVFTESTAQWKKFLIDSVYYSMI